MRKTNENNKTNRLKLLRAAAETAKAKTLKTAVRTVAKARKTANNFKVSFDPNGSYTGTPLDGGKPVQDVDDL